MKIRVKQNSINSVLSVIISLSDWDKGELDTIVRYGDPMVDIGGVFPLPGSKNVPVLPPSAASIDNCLRKFLAKLQPSSQEDLVSGNSIANWIVDLRDVASDISAYSPLDYTEHPECFFEETSEDKRLYADFPVMKQFTGEKAELRAKAWSDEIVRRLTVTIRGLRCFSTLVVKEEVYEV